MGEEELDGGRTANPGAADHAGVERVAAFDIEIASDIPAGEDWHKLIPLGISCAAVLLSDEAEPRLFCGGTLEAPADRMSVEDVEFLVNSLQRFLVEGYKIVTWNGAGFDFDVLSTETTRLRSLCRHLAMAHTDMMFHFFCSQGFPVALDKVAQGMGTERKTEGMHGDLAPVMWREGKRHEVMGYVGQDVRVTLAVYQNCLERKYLMWLTSKGGSRVWPLPNGWLSVAEALKLPLPDQSWMTAPWPREKFTGWMGAYAKNREEAPAYQRPAADRGVAEGATPG